MLNFKSLTAILVYLPLVQRSLLFPYCGILYFIIVIKRKISASRVARGLKFWLQVALSAPIATAWAEIRKSGSGSGKSGFSEKNFFAFFGFYGPLGTSGSPPDGPEPPNPDPDREIRFFRKSGFFVFSTF